MSSPGLKLVSVLALMVTVPALEGCGRCCRKNSEGSATTSAGYGVRRCPPSTNGSTASNKYGSSNKYASNGNNGASGKFGSSDGYGQNGKSTMRVNHGKNSFMLTGAMPTGATTGECYAQVYTMPEFDTVTEQVKVADAYESIEIVPAEYKWTEERIMVKPATTELVAVPAEFDTTDMVVETSPGFQSWVKADENHCTVQTNGPAPEDIFCLVSTPPTTTTVQAERLVKGPTVQKVSAPAEYQTVRVQKLVNPARTRRVVIPAQFESVTKTVMVSPGGVEWQRVSCDEAGYKFDNNNVRPVKYKNP